MHQIEMFCGLEQNGFKLSHNGKFLYPDMTIEQTDLQNNSTVNMMIPLLGGGEQKMTPAFVSLANKVLSEKSICRKCYATNPKKATNCRKRKCGKCSSLRPKKVLKR